MSYLPHAYCRTRAGIHTQQLNRNSDYDGASENQIRALNDAGYFQPPLSSLHTLIALAPATNGALSLDYRVHSYLAANCAQCISRAEPAEGRSMRGSRHRFRPQGSSMDRCSTISVTLRIVSSSLVPWRNQFSFPGSPTWVSANMPPLATSVLNLEALSLFSAWITNGLVGRQSFAIGKSLISDPRTRRNATPDADPDGDGAVNQLEYLTDTIPYRLAMVGRSASCEAKRRRQFTSRELPIGASRSNGPPHCLIRIRGSRWMCPATSRYFPPRTPAPRCKTRSRIRRAILSRADPRTLAPECPDPAFRSSQKKAETDPTTPKQQATDRAHGYA